MEPTPPQPGGPTAKRGLRPLDLALLGFVLLTAVVAGGRIATLHLGGYRPSPLGGDILDLARGGGWTALVVEGGRAVVTPGRRWGRSARDGVTWWTFPAVFAEGFEPADLQVDGRPCPSGDGTLPGTCRVGRRRVVAVTGPDDPAPTTLGFAGPPEAIAREAALRGLSAGDPPPAVYGGVEGIEGRVVAGNARGVVITVRTPPPVGSVLEFRPVVLESPIFAGVAPQEFEVSGRSLGSKDPEAPVLWRGAPVDPGGEPVRVPLAPIDTTKGFALEFRVPGMPRGVLGPLAAWADIAIGPAESPGCR